MTRVLILGANGQLARNTTRVFLEKTDVARDDRGRRGQDGREVHENQAVRIECGLGSLGGERVRDP